MHWRASSAYSACKQQAAAEEGPDRTAPEALRRWRRVDGELGEAGASEVGRAAGHQARQQFGKWAGMVQLAGATPPPGAGI